MGLLDRVIEFVGEKTGAQDAIDSAKRTAFIAWLLLFVLLAYVAVRVSRR